MPEIIQLFRVFVAAPSDVMAEHILIDELLRDWNTQHGPRARARVELVSWQTHSYPAAGSRPQALINKQAFDQADVVVAIFRGRFGSPTGTAASGTVEEIQRGIRMKKQVMVYFGPGGRRNRNQLVKIERFKRKLGKKALYHTFSDETSFQKAFRQHLAQAMNDVLAKSTLAVR